MEIAHCDCISFFLLIHSFIQFFFSLNFVYKLHHSISNISWQKSNEPFRKRSNLYLVLSKETTYFSSRPNNTINVCHIVRTHKSMRFHRIDDRTLPETPPFEFGIPFPSLPCNSVYNKLKNNTQRISIFSLVRPL